MRRERRKKKRLLNCTNARSANEKTKHYTLKNNSMRPKSKILDKQEKKKRRYKQELFEKTKVK
jgi:hypothetical protein